MQQGAWITRQSSTTMSAPRRCGWSGFLLAAVSTAVLAACSSGAHTSSPSAARSSPAAGSAYASHSAAPDTRLCGAWSSPESPQALALRASHGTLASCQLVGTTWYVTAIRDGWPGQIGYLVCASSDSTCLGGSAVHHLTRFRWVSAPASVGPGLKLYSAPAPNEWIFYTRTRGMVRFDLASKTFSTCPAGVCH